MLKESSKQNFEKDLEFLSQGNYHRIVINITDSMDKANFYILLDGDYLLQKEFDLTNPSQVILNVLVQNVSFVKSIKNLLSPQSDDSSKDLENHRKRYNAVTTLYNTIRKLSSCSKIELVIEEKDISPRLFRTLKCDAKRNSIRFSLI